MLIFGRQPFDEADDGTAGGGGGNGATAPETKETPGAAPAEQPGSGAAPAGAAPAADEPKGKDGMLAAISKMLDTPAADKKLAAESKAAAEAPAPASPTQDKDTGQPTAAEARKYLTDKGKAKDIAGKPDAEVLKLYETAKAAEKSAAPGKEKKLTKEEIDTPPEGVKKGSPAWQRFQRLANEVKQGNAEREKAEATIKERDATLGEMRTIFTETQTSAEDLAQLLEYNRLVKSGDLEGALQIVEAQRRAIAHQLGRPLDGVDLLEGFDDLKGELAEGAITQERAHEIAKARRDQAAARRAEDQRRATGQAEGKRKEIRERALKDITAFASQKAKEDVDYKKKEEILLKAVDRISKKFAPEYWLAALEEAYDMITVTSTAAPAGGERPNKDKQPLRPGGGTGGAPVAKTMGQAIDQALGYGPE